MALDLSFLDHPSFGASYEFDDAIHDDATPLSPEAPGAPGGPWNWEFGKSPAPLPAPPLAPSRSEARRASGGRSARRSSPAAPATPPPALAETGAPSPGDWMAELARYEEALLAEAASAPPVMRSPARRRTSATPGRPAERRPLEQQPRTLQRQQVAVGAGAAHAAPPCAFVVGDDGASAPVAAPRGVARVASAASFPQGASMVDKRTARLMHATSFRAALDDHRQASRYSV